ncbi:hypothetical protein COBT_004239, partial [Conglomerata obtusa]
IDQFWNNLKTGKPCKTEINVVNPFSFHFLNFTFENEYSSTFYKLGISLIVKRRGYDACSKNILLILLDMVCHKDDLDSDFPYNFDNLIIFRIYRYLSSYFKPDQP